MDSSISITKYDFDAICRLCLKKDKLMPIFNDSDKQLYSTSKLITELCGLKINPDDGFPMLICLNCLNCLIDFQLFRSSCLSSATILEHLKEAAKLDDNPEFTYTIYSEYSFDDFQDKNIAQNNDITQKNNDGGDIAEQFHHLKVLTNLEVTINDSESDSKLITTKTNNHSNSTTTTTTIDSKTNKGQTNGKTKKVVQKSIRKTGNKKSLKQCDICGTFVKEMSTHKYTHIASNQELYMECDYCGKKYFGRKNLRQHFETHFRTKKFECSVCDKKYKQRYELSQHMNSHTNEKIYKCSVCDKGFNQFKNRKRHEKIHNAPDKQCPYCDKLCTRNGNLREHIRTHTQEKPFKCEICNEKFSKSATLKKHKQKHL